MLFAILLYGEEEIVDFLSEQDYEETLNKHKALQKQYDEKGAFIASAKLMPSSSALVVRGEEPVMITDGPFAETKEQFVGFYLLECRDLEEAIAAAKCLPSRYHSMEVRPVEWLGGKAAE